MRSTIVLSFDSSFHSCGHPPTGRWHGYPRLPSWPAAPRPVPAASKPVALAGCLAQPPHQPGQNEFMGFRGQWTNIRCLSLTFCETTSQYTTLFRHRTLTPNLASCLPHITLCRDPCRIFGWQSRLALS